MSAWLGLGIQYWETLSRASSGIAAVWIMLRFFTVITNLVVAVVFCGRAAGWRGFGSARLVGGAAISILLVGVVNALLLHGLVELHGQGLVADVFLHDLTPSLAGAFWVMCQPKGGLRAQDPLIWAAYPLLYLAYAMVRGAVGGIYPYPFIDAGKIGWALVGTNAAAIAVVFLLVGYGVVWVDGWLARRGFGVDAAGV